MTKSVQNKRKITTYDMVMVALFAAVCYVATNFRIEIPTPVGKTMIHCGNVFCLLSALLMGGWRGGAANAIGLGLFDLLGGWASSAPSTIINRFLMGLIGGKVAAIGGNQNRKMLWNVAGAVAGMYSYVLLYIGYTFIKDLILGNAMATVLADVATKAATSSISGVLNIAVACLLYPVFRAALAKAGFFKRLNAEG